MSINIFMYIYIGENAHWDIYAPPPCKSFFISISILGRSGVNLLNLYYKLYRNRLPTYFESFLPEYGGHRHILRNDLIRLPIIRCEFEEMNAKYQMHLTLRELTSPGNSALYPTIQINDNTLGTSYKAFSMYLKSQFVNFYRVACNLANCYVCEISN